VKAVGHLASWRAKTYAIALKTLASSLDRAKPGAATHRSLGMKVFGVARYM
jgi:hypothetical protein